MWRCGLLSWLSETLHQQHRGSTVPEAAPCFVLPVSCSCKSSVVTIIRGSWWKHVACEHLLCEKWRTAGSRTPAISFLSVLFIRSYLNAPPSFFSFFFSLGHFTWEKYLKETCAIPAPAHCFKQVRGWMKTRNPRKMGHLQPRSFVPGMAPFLARKMLRIKQSLNRNHSVLKQRWKRYV